MMDAVFAKLAAVAQKCDDKNMSVEAMLFDRIMQKVASTVVITVTADEATNSWVAQSQPAQVRVDSPIYNPPTDRTPENYQRGIAEMKKTLAQQIAMTYPQGTHVVINPPQFALSAH